MEVKHSGQGQIFSNPILERLTRSHAFVPITMHYLIAFALLAYAIINHGLKVFDVVIFFVIGVFFWTFFEYLAHRYIFHMNTDTKIRERIQYTFHGVHHEYPRDKHRVVMPPVPGFIIAMLMIVLFRLLFGFSGFPLVAGFLAGYASYSLIHYSTHTKIPPKNFMGKLWMHHSLHHYKDHTRAFGVSSPLWDIIFGTMPKKYR